MKLFIEPVDVWLFRDGRPFDQGTDHLARTVFPPLPTVMQGVIRTHHIECNGGIPAYLERRLPEVEEIVGKPGGPPPDTFHLRGPFVARRLDMPGNSHDVDLYFPLPADAYLDGDTYRALELRREGIITDLGSASLLWLRAGRRPTKDEEVEGGIWLNLRALETYLRAGTIPKGCTTAGSRLFARERRIGIQRDDQRRATVEQMLYEVEFIRLCECEGVGLYVEVEGVDGWPDRGVLGIGGEGRSGRYEQVRTPNIRHPIDTNAKWFKIIFLTPAYFKQGWQADDWKSLLGADVVFMGAAVNRPITLGGFDQAKKRQKPARRYVPAGSVYFFEGTPPLHLKSITQDGANIGFGQFIIGGR
jgi:CRISPR-associated protein Cmr3